MEHPPETLTRGAVQLRRWRARDAAVVDRVVTESLDHLLPWMPWADGHTAESAAAFTAESERQWAAGEAYQYAITCDGREVGSCGLMRRIGPGGLEIGYWLHPGWTGRGLATSAVRALTDAAFALPGTERVEIHHDAANLASGAVARRAGFTEVERRPDEGPQPPGQCGTEVVQRLVR
ncbi:GNAT family N-acetyltransferase [Peterkaempfera griseoplana]|uniref:GNAT family N-acetyltransferase n=1 Tax=Peterkaempfera griseoplana TaxID=66896 RepID=UPI0006E2815A|nr:GNAT family N-acetyltransferase [Peterkaempfera griseoplana]